MLFSKMPKFDNEFYLNIARGAVPGWSAVQKFGKNPSVGTTFVPICYSGFYRTPTTLTSLEAVSDSADDTDNGAGARSLFIQGIGTDYKEVSEIVALNGTTPVALANQYYRVYRWFVYTSGTYATQLAGSHVGDLIIQESGGGDVWSSLNETSTFPRGQSQIGAFTIPDGYVGYVPEVTFNIDSGKACDIALFVRTGIDNVVAPFDPMRLQAEANGAVGFSRFELKVPLGPIPAKSDVGVMARVSQLPAAQISVDFTILLEKKL